jgi:hypothetical protein
VPATCRMCVVCCSTVVVILCCGVTACWDLPSEYRLCWFFFGLPMKSLKAEHVWGIPLGLYICGLGCSSLILCIYADPRGECYCFAVAVLSADGGEVVSHMHRLPFMPRKIPGTHFC